jgi:hypothetical protein
VPLWQHSLEVVHAPPAETQVPPDDEPDEQFEAAAHTP